MSVTGTASPAPGIKKSMLQRGLQDSVCVTSSPLSMSLHTQFFTLSQISHIWPLSLMHKTHWDTGPLHLLFPGPPALPRVFLKVLFVYHWDLSAKGRWEGPGRSKAVCKSPSSEPLISTCPLETFPSSPPALPSLQLFIKTCAYLIWLGDCCPSEKSGFPRGQLVRIREQQLSDFGLKSLCAQHITWPCHDYSS